jgi:hypothetical protein
MIATHPYLVASWTDDDLASLREWRAKQGRVIQDITSGRDEVRDAKKYEKSATMVLQAIEGTGPCARGIPRDFFPAELEMHLMTATSYIGRQA